MSVRTEQMTAHDDSERFRSGVEKYADYLKTPEGRLRLDLAFANVMESLPQDTSSLRALDLGCGTGVNAIRLARLGLHVTLLDSSLPMLDFAKRAAKEAGVPDNKIELKHGDAAQLTTLFEPESFDVVLCHNVLEFAAEPITVLRGVALAMRDSSAVLSVLVRNQSGEVLKNAIQAGDLEAAEMSLTSEWGRESTYGGSVRLFTSDGLQTLLKEASLMVSAVRGVRVVADYLPTQVRRDADYERILELERKLGCRPEFAAVARYTQCLAHPQVP